MRYYKIELTNPKSTSEKPTVFTSQVNGQNDPGALDVNFDLWVAGFATPISASVVQIWGIPIQTISQANNLTGYNVVVSAGFQKGLPLANPDQAGIIARGNIIQAFGNWQGNDMTLDLVILPGLLTPNSPSPTGSSNQPFNGSFNWPAGQKLSDALAAFFTALQPGFNPPQININPNLVMPYDQTGAYRSLWSFAQWLKPLTQSWINDKTYPGVSIRIDNGNTYVAFDNTPSSQAASAAVSSQQSITRTVDISYKDLIGQPIWIDVATIQFKCPMRADINVGDKVVLPPGYYGIAPQDPSAPYNYRNKSIQQGAPTVTEIHHLGSFRQPDGNSWVTTFTCVFPDVAA